MRFPTEPGGLGHEGWGVVDAVGDGVVGLSEGDRVAALTYHAYAEHDLADADAVVPLPDALRAKPFPGRAARLRHEHLRPQRHRGGQTVAGRRDRLSWARS
jgi:hypothetical protein